MQCTMRLFGKPGIPTVTGNLRVSETAQEITYRPVVNNVESEEERVSTCARTPCGSSLSAATSRTWLNWPRAAEQLLRRHGVRLILSTSPT